MVIVQALVATAIELEFHDESGRRIGIAQQGDLKKYFDLNGEAKITKEANGLLSVSDTNLVVGFQAVAASSVLPEQRSTR
jgi:hypothetical protein